MAARQHLSRQAGRRQEERAIEGEEVELKRISLNDTQHERRGFIGFVCSAQLFGGISFIVGGRT